MTRAVSSLYESSFDHFRIGNGLTCLITKKKRLDTLALYEALVGSGRLKEELKAEDRLTQARKKGRGRQPQYLGWE